LLEVGWAAAFASVSRGDASSADNEDTGPATDDRGKASFEVKEASGPPGVSNTEAELG